MPEVIDELVKQLPEPDIARLVHAFYARVANDDIIGTMYPREDLTGAEHRLCAFLIFRLGGSDAYLAERGHPRLRARHAPFAIDRAAADRWVKLMREAMAEVQTPEPARAELDTFFAEMALFLVNRR